MIRHDFKQRLVHRITASQSMESNVLGIQIDLTSHQPPRPKWGHIKASAHQVSPTTVIGTTQEDDLPAQRNMGIELKALGEGATQGRLLAARRAAGAVRRNIACIDSQQLGEVLEAVPLPDLGLPQAVEGFDAVLEARLTRWCEYRHHAQRQAQAADATDGVGKLMGTLKHGGIVELGAVRQAQLCPAFAQSREHRIGWRV
jgi:hypothetical protein